MANQTCFHCEWYRSGDTYTMPYCAKGRAGFPHVADFCRDFEGEPGTRDEE